MLVVLQYLLCASLIWYKPSEAQVDMADELTANKLYRSSLEHLPSEERLAVDGKVA